MNEKLYEKTDPARRETNPSGPGKFQLARWQTLADFSSRSAHQRVHKPAVRISYTLLRNATFCFVFALQTILPPALGRTITGGVSTDNRVTIYEFSNVYAHISTRIASSSSILVLDSPGFATCGFTVTLINLPEPGK